MKFSIRALDDPLRLRGMPLDQMMIFGNTRMVTQTRVHGKRPNRLALTSIGAMLGRGTTRGRKPMPTTMKGPGLFLAQFVGDAAPFNSLASITKWAAGLGYKGVQIPTWDGRLFDLKKAASSKTYCDEVKGICANAGVEITELSTHLQGQLVAVHPAYDAQFD